jgi:hypothetical protein
MKRRAEVRATVRESVWVVGAVGLLTVVLIGVGADTIGGLLALLQLGLLVGSPLALVLHRELRSWSVVVVVAVALSVALSAIAAQALIWFELATPELIVATATAYGIAVAVLLSPVAPARRDDGPGEVPTR